MKRNIYTSNKGFSLLEITVVIIIITILASAAIPVLSRVYLEKAGTKIALDISAIQDAARAYYINNNAWPGVKSGNAMGDLTTGNYLPSSWNAINPFGFSATNPAATYNYNISVNGSSNGASLIVYTYVPTAAQSILENLLPASGVLQNNNVNYVYSSISVPGSSSILPTGIILPWASSTLPAGFLWCNGKVFDVSSYQNLYNIIGQTYDVPGDGADGVNTFAVPDLMARTIVGVDGMGGITATNRIALWGSSSKIIGGSFGEGAHALTATEIPPLTLQIPVLQAHWGSSGDGYIFPNQLSNNGNYVYYNTNGGGQAHNIVQPSIAMGYIIKY